MTKRWMLCNCEQCWTCKNCTDHYIFDKKIVLANSPLKNENINCAEDDAIDLAYCKVQDCAMTYVNNNPCPYYNKK